MRKPTALAMLVALVTLTAGFSLGDSLFGRVTAVRSADLVVFAHPTGSYNLRLVGIVVPKDRASADRAALFVRNMVLGKPARLRNEGRTREGELRARLFTADANIREVAVELVRAGMVSKAANFDFKYGELGSAQKEAQSARRGLWAR